MTLAIDSELVDDIAIGRIERAQERLKNVVYEALDEDSRGLLAELYVTLSNAYMPIFDMPEFARTALATEAVAELKDAALRAEKFIQLAVKAQARKDIAEWRDDR